MEIPTTEETMHIGEVEIQPPSVTLFVTHVYGLYAKTVEETVNLPWDNRDDIPDEKALEMALMEEAIINDSDIIKCEIVGEYNNGRGVTVKITKDKFFAVSDTVPTDHTNASPPTINQEYIEEILENHNIAPDDVTEIQTCYTETETHFDY